MKVKIDELESAYDKCCAGGLILPRNDTDVEKSKSLQELAMMALNRIEAFGEKFENETDNYSFMLRDHYEILRMLIDSFLLFDKAIISNHQCSNAYLCIKHPELEFDWTLLESMRLIRNAVNYQGKRVSREQWKSLKMPFEVYISSLSKAISEKLK